MAFCCHVAVDKIKRLLHRNNIHSSTIQTEILDPCAQVCAVVCSEGHADMLRCAHTRVPRVMLFVLERWRSTCEFEVRITWA